MLPLSKNKKYDDYSNSFLKTILPQTILIILTVSYFLLPLIFCNETTLISRPISTTLFFVVLFGILESIVFCYVWDWCKITQNHDNEKIYRFKLIRGIGIFAACFSASHIVCVLFGAALTQYVQETATWALLVTCFVAIPNLCVFGSDLEPWYRVIICGKFTDHLEQFLYFQCLGVIIGSWASAVVIPLDWDRDWQVWPIPCIFGCVCGYVLALLIHCIVVVRDLKRIKTS